MKKKVIQILSIALCMVLLSGSTVTANAAKKSSNTGAYQAVFDAEYYYNSNPDLQAAFGYDAQKLFNHFVSSGIYEGRSGCANFNVAIYRANYPDLQAAFGNDLASYCAHYAANGAYHIQQTFSCPVYVVLYLIWLFALWFHLTHGFWSSMQSLGWNNKVWINRWKCISNIYSTIVVLGFALVVVVFFVKSLLCGGAC